MGSFSTTTDDDNPFTWNEEGEYIEEGKERDEYPNPLRAIYDDLAPLLFESDPSTRYPKEFSAVKGFDILIDPLSALMPSSAVPDPVIGLTTQRSYRPSIQGVEGLATHMNILVDSSGSMDSGTIYGYGKTGFPLAGVDIATIATAMMVAQCGIAKDSFSIFEFGRTTAPVWEGPSMEHQACIDWLMGDFSGESRPFKPLNGTPLAQGLALAYNSMADYDFDQAVNCVIMDATFSESTWRSEIFKSGQPNDEDLRKNGNITYYILIGSGADENVAKQLKDAANSLRKVLREHYKEDLDKFVMDFSITMDESGNFKEFAGSLVEIASMNMKKKNEYAEEQAEEGKVVVS